MFAILALLTEMWEGQWLLIMLTADVCGSLLSVGSAAGLALMGQAKGIYTYMTYLKWAPEIGLGYLGRVAAHF